MASQFSSQPWCCKYEYVDLSISLSLRPLSQRRLALVDSLKPWAGARYLSATLADGGKREGRR